MEILDYSFVVFSYKGIPSFAAFNKYFLKVKTLQENVAVVLLGLLYKDIALLI